MILRPPDPPLSDGVVRLRPPGPGDVSRIVDACNDPEMLRWTTVPSPYRERDALAFLREVDEGWTEGTGAVFAVTAAPAGPLDGMIGLHLVDHGVATVGYWAAPWARGRGMTSRGLALVVAWAFAAAGIRRIDLMTLPGNVRSERVAERAGFVRGEIVPEGFDHNGVRADVWGWSLLAPEA